MLTRLANRSFAIARNGCRRAAVDFARAPLAPTPRIAGRETSLDNAVRAAARLLRRARQPLFGGLATDVEGVRAAVDLAERCGATLDHAHGETLAAMTRLLQTRGWYAATLSELRNRADLVVLEDNRLQSLALSIAEARGVAGLPGFVRTIEILEASGRLDRKVEGIEASDELLRRGVEGRGLTRPELAVLLSKSKMALQSASETLHLADDPLMEAELFAAFPKAMIRKHAAAIRAHRLRHEIVATKVANRLVNRLGPSMALDLTEEEGVSLAQVASAFLVTEQLLDLRPLWARIEAANVPEQARIELFTSAARSIRTHIADVLRAAGSETSVSTLVALFAPGLDKVSSNRSKLIRTEVKGESAVRRQQLLALGAEPAIVDALIRLYELDGVFAIAALAARKDLDELSLTRAYAQIGEALGLDWALHQLVRFTPSDPWERLVLSGLARDFEQLRIDFLARSRAADCDSGVERWIERNQARIDQFRSLVTRAKAAGAVSVPMLAQIASQARILLAR